MARYTSTNWAGQDHQDFVNDLNAAIISDSDFFNFGNFPVRVMDGLWRIKITEVAQNKFIYLYFSLRLECTHDLFGSSNFKNNVA